MPSLANAVCATRKVLVSLIPLLGSMASHMAQIRRQLFPCRLAFTADTMPDMMNPVAMCT